MVRVTFNGVSLDSVNARKPPSLQKEFSKESKNYSRKGILGKLNIPIALILRKMDEGMTEESLTRNSVIFDKRDVRAALTYATMYLPERPEYKRNNRYKRVNILLDENLSFYLIPELSKQLSNLSHIYFEGMRGYTDEFIYWRPNAKLKKRTAKEERQHKKIKNIIISQDSDITDIARKQWRDRMLSSSDPENIDFSDVNVVFHVCDNSMGKPENAAWYLPYAKDILKAAHSQQASSYVITRGGVRPEIGCSREEIIKEIERSIMFERIKSGELDQEAAEEFYRGKAAREARRTPSAVLTLEAA